MSATGLSVRSMAFTRSVTMEWKIAKAVLEHSDECTFVDYFHDSRHITAYNERVLKYACFASLIENKKVMPR